MPIRHDIPKPGPKYGAHDKPRSSIENFFRGNAVPGRTPARRPEAKKKTHRHQDAIPMNGKRCPFPMPVERYMQSNFLHAPCKVEGEKRPDKGSNYRALLGFFGYPEIVDVRSPGGQEMSVVWKNPKCAPNSRNSLLQFAKTLHNINFL